MTCTQPRCKRVRMPAPPPGKKKKTPAPKYDSSDESSSKHKKKKGLDKLNPILNLSNRH